MSQSLVAVILATMFLLIINLLRRKFIKEKYAAPWIITGIFTLLAAIFPDVFIRISRILGFQVYSNFLFLVFGSIITLIFIQMSFELSDQEEKIAILAEEVALLRNKVD